MTHILFRDLRTKHWVIVIACIACAGAFIMLSRKNVPESATDSMTSITRQLHDIVDLGPGVHKIVKDKKGHITSCVVVGQARIVLGKSEGLEQACDKADLDCSAEFVKWLKEEVGVCESSDGETVTLVERTEGGEDGDSLKESGKSIEKSSKKMASISTALVRGMQLIHKEVDADGKTYSVVKGWKADTAEGVKKISADLASDEPADKGTEETKTLDKDIESDSRSIEGSDDH